MRPRGRGHGGRDGGHLDRDPQGEAYRGPEESQAKIQRPVPCRDYHSQRRGEINQSIVKNAEFCICQGLTGIYKGVGPTVCKQGSNQAIRFFLMETMRGMYTGGDHGVQVPYYFVALFGFIAGTCRLQFYLTPSP